MTDEELREIVAAAGAESWSSDGRGVIAHRNGNGPAYTRVHKSPTRPTYEEHLRDGDLAISRFIATFNPAFISALLAEREELRAALRAIIAECRNDGYPNEIVAMRMIERIEEEACDALNSTGGEG